MVLNDERVFAPLEVAIDPDAFNAFEAARWEGKASAYDFVGSRARQLSTARFGEPAAHISASTCD